MRNVTLDREFKTDVGGVVAPKAQLSFLEEWRASGVKDSITLANVRYYEGREALALITEHAIAQRQKVTSYATEPAKNILKRNENVEAGGWFVAGLDPLNNGERMEWGQFKPVVPRIDSTNGKPIKYQSPEGMEARATFLKDPDHPNFWADVMADCSIVVYICEGAKKAGLLLSLGYAAISIPGIWMAGRWKDKHGRLPNPHLIPELAAFAQAGRKFVFVFDEDEKPKTRRDVAAAIWQTTKLLFAKGCEVAKTHWNPEEGKGVDDLWANKGTDRVHEVLAAAVAPVSGWTRDQTIAARLKQFEEYAEPLLKIDCELTETKTRKVHYYNGYCPQFVDALVNAVPTIGVRGWLGSGKTEAAIASLLGWIRERLSGKEANCLD
ncbi:MAG: DUF3854 domain-containing protein [Leptolyngbyaceae cyanobacterium CSU_1_4]|nr:DUF3854 domain-containing protein [Leptolyngbyaceae cyanobacterium CSU_1_4]